MPLPVLPVFFHVTEETFAQAVRTYGDTVYRVAFHALNSREDAEDVTQTVMLKLFEYGKEFESEAHLKHWLLRVSVMIELLGHGTLPHRILKEHKHSHG